MKLKVSMTHTYNFQEKTYLFNYEITHEGIKENNLDVFYEYEKKNNEKCKSCKYFHVCTKIHIKAFPSVQQALSFAFFANYQIPACEVNIEGHADFYNYLKIDSVREV